MKQSTITLNSLGNVLSDDLQDLAIKRPKQNYIHIKAPGTRLKGKRYSMKHSLSVFGFFIRHCQWDTFFILIPTRPNSNSFGLPILFLSLSLRLLTVDSRLESTQRFFRGAVPSNAKEVVRGGRRSMFGNRFDV